MRTFIYYLIQSKLRCYIFSWNSLKSISVLAIPMSKFALKSPIVTSTDCFLKTFSRLSSVKMPKNHLKFNLEIYKVQQNDKVYHLSLLAVYFLSLITGDLVSLHAINFPFCLSTSHNIDFLFISSTSELLISEKVGWTRLHLTNIIFPTRFSNTKINTFFFQITCVIFHI